MNFVDYVYLLYNYIALHLKVLNSYTFVLMYISISVSSLYLFNLKVNQFILLYFGLNII
jgi:hypothetical protein